MTVLGKLAAVLLVCVISTSVFAESIIYGDYDVTTAQFLDVAEDGIVVSGVTEPLYGSPTPAGNSLLFNPVSFGAYAAGLDSNTLDGRLEAEIEADAGYGLDGIAIIEGGDYSFIGIGTSNTSVAANLSVFITILEVNGQPITNPLNPLYTIDFTQNLFSANLSEGILDDFWSGEVFSDFYGHVGEEEAITKISVVIDNTLNATSEVETEAYIGKKQFQLRAFMSTASYVPEPSTIVLIGLGALSLLFFRRKAR